MLRQRPLFGVAVGAGLATAAFLTVHFLPFGPQDKRFLEIRVVPGGAAQQGAIAAAGRCRAQFTALMPDHAFIVRIPLKSLDADDFICLTDQLGTIAHQAVIAR